MFERYRPQYIAGRLLRRMMPERLAHRLLSKRRLSAEYLYESATRDRYLRGIAIAGIERVLPNGSALTILEAGTGVYNPAAAPLLWCGVERLILLEPFLGGKVDEARLCERIASLLDTAAADAEFPERRCERADLVPPGNDRLPRGVELLDRLWEDTGLAQDSIDVIFSMSVLEHVRHPDAVLDECRRILRPGGWMINSVDMRDHFFRYPLDMLKYSERAWRMLATHQGGAGYMNRWRVSQWLEALERNHFRTHMIPLERLDAEVAREQAYLALPFREMDPEVLSVGKALLVSELTD